MSIAVESRGNNQFEVVVKQTLPHLPFDDIYVIDLVKSGRGRGPATSAQHNYGAEHESDARGGPIGERSSSVKVPVQAFYSVVSQCLEMSGNRHHYVATTSATSIAEFAQSLKSPKALVIFILGDTSVNEFVDHLPNNDEKSTLFVLPLPAGTGNALALSFDLNLVTLAMNHLYASAANPFAQPLNVYEAIYGDVRKIFTVVFSWAFHAALVADADTPGMRKMGLQRFQVAARANLAKPNRYQGDINDDKGPWSYFVVTPAQRFEPKFVISPCGNIKKDSLYLVAFRSGVDIMPIMDQVCDNGAHINNPEVIYREVAPMQLTLKHRADHPGEDRFCIDGEIVTIPDGEIRFNSLRNRVGSYELYTVQ